MSDVLNKNLGLMSMGEKPGVRTGKGSGQLAGHCEFNSDVMKQTALMPGKRFST